MRIVMTGATAGFGLFAAARLAATGHTLTIGARTHDKLPPEISGRVRAEPLDLDSLAKVRPGGRKILTGSGTHDPAEKMAFDPGYVPHTALGRDNPKWVATLVSYILPLLMKRDRSSTIPRSGQFLADLSVNDQFANSRGSYWAVRGVHLLQTQPSVLARDDAACAALWEDSARLVGLPCD